MASNPSIKALALNSDFTALDISKANIDTISKDTSLQAIVNSPIRYEKASQDNPTGIWVVNNQRVTAGQILLAQIYGGWLSANTNAQTQLVAMNANTTLAKSASAFSKAITDKAGAGTSLSYSELVTLASSYISNTGLTATKFVETVLPNETSSSTYTPTELTSLTETINQYSNARLTDNTVLQNKYESATSIINSCMDAMSNLMKAWQTMLTTVGRSI